MSDTTPNPPDFELHSEPRAGYEAPPRRPPAVLWVVVALLIAAAVSVYLFGRKQPAPVAQSPQGDATAPPQTAAPLTPLGGEPAPIVLPPLDESDAVVRELFKQLTTHPSVAAWLATDGLLRKAAVVLASVTDGRTPSAQLTVLRPSERFAIVERDGRMYLDPRSYKRYDQLAAAADSIDAAGAARLYATLKPRLGEAYGALGRPDTSLDQAVERALVTLLETPIVDDPVALEPARAVGYAFVDPRLEALSGAQKQLLRMGPENVRTIQRSLRAIALALGIPVGRLPAPHV